LQGMAICVITVLQEDVDDAYRGRVFAFYDVMFNVSLAVGALLSAIFMPLNGKSPTIIAAVAAGYAVAAGGRRRGRPPPPPRPARYVQALHLGPAQQFLSGPVAAQRAVLHALVEQVTVGLADERPRRLPQDLHDLGAVQVGPDLVQFLLLGQDSDPPFQVVVGT